MPALKDHHRKTKSSRRNPYADRGLDQFALVSAELQETREKLLAQFGTSLSLIRFAIGPDQTEWVPIIVSQTSSKAEIGALRRAASDLIIGNKHSFDDFDDGNHTAAASGIDGGHSHAWNEDPHLCTRVSDDNGSRISSNNTHVGSGVSERDTHPAGSEVSIESRCVTSIEMKSDLGVDAGISKACERSYLMVTIQRFLWILQVIVFSSRIVADIARNAILRKHNADDEKVRNLCPSKDVSHIIDHPSVDIAPASLKQHLSNSLPRSIAKDDIKSLKPLPSLHIEAPNTISRLPSAPSTPPASCQLAKPMQASISFPRTPHSHSLAPHIDIKENEPVQKMIPNMAIGSFISNTGTGKETGSEKERKKFIVSEKLSQKDMSERLGQALTGAGLMLILSGLLMGYIPAIISVICWWYVLPSMRRAVGDKPFVRSHHRHSSPEDRNANTVNNKARGKHVESGKEDMHSHEDKKKVITNGILDRHHRHHSQA